MAALAALLLAFGGLQGNLSHAAGFPVQCHAIAHGYAGEAVLDERVIVLSPDTCDGFHGSPLRQVDSLVTLGHERAHLLGVTDERAADCKGVRDARWLGRRLGLRVSSAAVRAYAGPLHRCS